MATVNTNTPMCEGAETVRVGVVLCGIPEGDDCIVISEDGHGVSYTPAKNKEARSFSFDQVVNDNNLQSFHPELLQPLTESVCGGYNGALLICGVPTERICSLTYHSIIKQLLANLFSRMLSRVKEELFISVSSLQFYPDGTAVDVLSPNRQTLKLVTHPVLGRLVGGLCEVCVSSEEEAYVLYETRRETLEAGAGSISSRCSSLFSVAVEWKLHPEEAESEVCRSRLQLFSLAGGASRTDLRGVSPLLKVVDQIQCGATATDELLPFLLHEALTGNSRAVLLYCVSPQGLLDDETPSALALAQRARSLVTKATIGRWCPKATEREIRDKIMDVQTLMMSQGESEAPNIHRLAELTQDLQIVKNQSWESRREESNKIKGETQRSRQTPNSNRQSSNHKESTDAMKYLQDQLRREMEEHIREGKGSVEKVQERVARIQALKGALREETLKNGPVTEKSDLCQQSLLEYNKAMEQRRQLKEDHVRLIQEEAEKMERDLAQEELPTESPQRELLVLTRERQVLVLQMEALRTEAQRAERDLQDQNHKHQKELRCLREESLQVFRVFRQVKEEQRRMSEGRYRCELLEAVQDAVYLSAQNQQLRADNKQLHKALGELKDALAVRVDPKAERLSRQQ